MVKTWILYILSLLAVFIFFLFYKMWAAWYFLVIMLLLPVACLCLGLFASWHFSIEPEAPESVLKDEEKSIRIKIGGTASGLCFVRFGAYMTDVMTDEYKKLGVYRCDSGSPDIPLHTEHCGAYVYRITDVRVYDLLGFWGFRRHFDTKIKVLVRPQMIIPELSPDLSGYKARGVRRARSAFSEIYDFREYVPGDPIRSIHWKASAKRDNLLVREMQEECYAHSQDLLKLNQPRDMIDQRLGELLFTATFFLEHDLFARIRVMVSKSRENIYDIESTKDLDRVIVRILHMNLPKEAVNED